MLLFPDAKNCLKYARDNYNSPEKELAVISHNLEEVEVRKLKIIWKKLNSVSANI